MTLSRAVRVLAAVVAVLAFAAMLGCAKKVTAPDSGFTSLEGVQSGDVLLMGWQQPERFVAHFLDPGTPTEENDDYVALVEHLSADSVGHVMAMAFDYSRANGMQAFRSYPDGALAAMFDYPLRPFIKDLPLQRDIFTFEDALPASSDAKYVLRGTTNGVASSHSPLSNPSWPLGAIDEQAMSLTTANRFQDSLAVVSWTPVPNAALYVVNVLDFNEVASSRKKAVYLNFPVPIYPDPTVSQSVLLTTSTSIPFNFVGAHFPIRLVLRVAAVDANFRIVSRLNPGAATLLTTPAGSSNPYKIRFTEEGPAGFNAYAVMPMGGVKLVFDPFNVDVRPQFAANGSPTATINTPRVSPRWMPAGLTPRQARAAIERSASNRSSR